MGSQGSNASSGGQKRLRLVCAVDSYLGNEGLDQSVHLLCGLHGCVENLGISS